MAAALATLAAAACGDGGYDSTPQAGTPPPELRVEQVFTGLPAFAQPIAMLQAPGSAARWFVVEQPGRVRAFSNAPAVSSTALFIDISGRVTFRGEMGLLGMAFHPQFPTDPRAYLFYSHTDATLGIVSRLSEFSSADGGATLDAASERILLTIRKPGQPQEENHNGGGIAFGPDGFLYAGIGDGGGGNDQHGAIGNAQLASTLLGKMLRIDVSGATGYGIPADNPFVGNPANALCGADGSGTQPCPEIFAIGLRNPWRWSFDRQTGQLWVADVGQGALEEVDRVVLGGNYGWRCFEGTRNTGMSCGSPAQTSPPLAEYGRSVGRSITGGYVYRGSAHAGLVGRYVFGDFVTGRLLNIAADTQPTLSLNSGPTTGFNISSFGEGNDGEVYAVDYGGRLYRVVP
jgi:glucose/arabinose dehydrogenase